MILQIIVIKKYSSLYTSYLNELRDLNVLYTTDKGEYYIECDKNDSQLFQKVFLCWHKINKLSEYLLLNDAIENAGNVFYETWGSLENFEKQIQEEHNNDSVSIVVNEYCQLLDEYMQQNSVE